LIWKQVNKLKRNFSLQHLPKSGGQQPRLEVLFEIAKTLDVKPKDLLKDKI
jgi:ABC-type phosphate transport system ATPase subunit